MKCNHICNFQRILVTFTEKNLNGKLHFLRSVTCSLKVSVKSAIYALKRQRFQALLKYICLMVNCQYKMSLQESMIRI